MASKFSLNKILSQDLQEVNKYNKKELTEIVKFMNQTVKKRLERLEKFEEETGSTSPALYRMRVHGDIKADDVYNKLRNDFKTAYNFLTDPTSKITTWKDIRKSLKNKFESYTGLPNKNYKWVDGFFKIYNKYSEMDSYNAVMQLLSSEQVFREAAQTYAQIEKNIKDPEEIMQEFSDRMDRLYYEAISEYNDEY